MVEERQKCAKCGESTNTLKRCKFFYGCVTSSPGGRQFWFDPCPGASSPSYIHTQIEGSKEALICDGCIRSERISQLKSDIKATLTGAFAYTVVGALLYHYWSPVNAALKNMDTVLEKWSIPCCALPAVILGGLIILMFLILPLVLVHKAFENWGKSAEEIGDAIAIEVNKTAIEKSAHWINPQVQIIDGYVMVPRRVMAFWTRKQKETEKLT